MGQPKKAAKRSPVAKKAAAKKKSAAKQPEPEIQVNRVTETRSDNSKPSDQDPPLFEGTPDELDENGETQADRDAAGEAWREKTRSSGTVDLDEYEQVHEPLEHADFDHHAAEHQRQVELHRAREKHNSLTAGSANS